jgi:hypothetical protein
LDTPELFDARSVRLESSDGEAIVLRCSTPSDVWCLPVRTTIKTLSGYRAVDQGVVLVHLLRVDGEASVTLDIDLDGSTADHANVRDDALADDEEAGLEDGDDEADGDFEEDSEDEADVEEDDAGDDLDEGEGEEAADDSPAEEENSSDSEAAEASEESADPDDDWVEEDET